VVVELKIAVVLKMPTGLGLKRYYDGEKCEYRE
jgi:hypothetical protein